MLKIVLTTVLGVFAGVFTGLTPGIHPNTVIFFSMPFYFSSGVETVVYGAFISGLAVSHTFHDFIPSLFLGLPDSSTALSTIPGIELVSRGRGLEVFRYSVEGGIYATLTVAILAPLVLAAGPALYPVLEPAMEYLLLFFLITTILNTSRISRSALTAILSGILGLIAFKMPVNQSYVFIPIFSGLFAVPVIVSSFSGRAIPEQQDIGTVDSVARNGGAAGAMAGLLAGIVPGVGAAIATSFLSPLMTDSRKQFIAGLGGVNTADTLVSLIALLALGKARSGPAVAISAVTTVTAPGVAMLSGASLLAAGLSAPIALYAGEKFARFSSGGSSEPLLAAALSVVCVSTLFLTGFPGALILATSSVIGYGAMLSGDRRPCMAVLIVPAIMFFAEIHIFM
ncbi:MAG: tripartite tricarboxylate transporter permease [Candidatus Nanohaloarchaea archaeon]